MSSVPKTKLTPQKYLSIERRAEYKSEFFKGEMFAMVGACRKHNLISTNVTRELRVCESIDLRWGRIQDVVVSTGTSLPYDVVAFRRFDLFTSSED